MGDQEESPRRDTANRRVVGRAREQTALRDEMMAAFAGAGRLVVIGGEAGIGKTTLARFLAGQAAALGAEVLSGYCIDLATPPPFGPWVDMAARYRPGPDQPVAPSMFRDANFAGVSSQTALIVQMTEFLTECTRRRPLLLVLEDLHWSDAGSIELLKIVASRVTDLPALVLVTYRVDELTRHHPLYRQLPRLMRAGPGLRLDLHRLDRAGLGALVEISSNPGPADLENLIAYLERHAEGNPYFAVELLRALDEAGIWPVGGGRAGLAPLNGVILPSVLEQVIDSRVARLGEAMRTPLAQAAVIGQEIRLDLWAEVAGLHPSELLAIVERAVEAHLLEADQDGERVRFVHALTREALALSVVPPRRRLWHLRAAEAMAPLPAPDPDVVAHHFQHAGDPRAVEWLIRAGERAQRAYAWVSAANRFITASEQTGAKADELRVAWLLYRAARLLRVADPMRGVALLSQVMEIGDGLTDQVLAFDARYSRGYLLAYANQFEEGIRETIAGIDLLESLPPARAAGDRLLADWLADSLPVHHDDADRDVEAARLLHEASGIHHRRGGQALFTSMAGRYRESIETADQFIAAAAGLDRPGGLVRSSAGHASFGSGTSYAALGRAADARSSFAHSRDIYAELDHHALYAFNALDELQDVAMTFDADRPERRRALAIDAEAALRRAGGALLPEVSPRIAQLPAAVVDGDWRRARSILADAPVPLNVLLGRPVVEAAGVIARFEGRMVDLQHLIEDALPEGVDAVPGARHFQFTVSLQRLAAETAIDSGELDGAKSWLDAHDRWLAWNGSVLGLAAGDLVWARWRLAAGDGSRARAIALQGHDRGTRTRQPLVLQGAERLLGHLAFKEGDFNRAEEHFHNALTISERCQAPLESALTLTTLAESRAASGRTRDAAASSVMARALCQEIKGLALEHRLDRLDAMLGSAVEPLPFGLTIRELDVLRLVAEGLTDAGVAERLYISPRTVGQHLRSIYVKLGVSSRSAATRLAVQSGLT